MEQGTKPIYTWDAQPSRRNLTTADILRAALAAFRDASLDGSFPGAAENAKIPQKELDAFLTALEKNS